MRTTFVPTILLGLTLVSTATLSCSDSPEHQGALGSEPAEPRSSREQALTGPEAVTDIPGQNAFINATAAILNVNGNGTTCTGVLVSPNQVLTAGHCVCKSGQAPSVVVGSQVVFPTVSSAGPNPATAGFNSVYIVTSIDTNSNWLAGNCGEGNYSIVWDKERESYDLAVLTLNTSVLSSVATPVAIQFSSHTNLERFATAGFGANSANGDVMCDTSGSSVSCTGYDDLRRNGRVLNVWYKDDICDKSSLDGPCWHTPILMSHLFSNAPTQSLSGDSGSPVVGFLPGSNVARLIGIHVYRFDDGGYQYGKQMVRVRLANDESKSFLASKITSVANDLDGDGISDVADNCKPGACTTHGFVGCKEDNPDQADADGDGVGDSCDNCSPINSKKCPSGTTCANPNNSDYDGDGFGDTCDPFPGCAANDFASCVGCTVFYQTAYCSFNGGTNCAGTGRFTASCTSTANCPSVAGQQCLLDGTSGRCLKPADSDSDTVADVCDQCPNFANNTFNGTDFNSNPDAELNANVQALGDQCDPAPIAPLGDPDTPPVITVNNGIPTQPSQTEVRRHGFFTNTSRGKVTANEVAKSDPGSIRFRGCQCDPTATLCVDRNGSCNTAVAPLTATANWKPISMTNASGTALPNPPVANNEMFSNTGYGPNKKWYWQWYSDVYTLGTFSQNLLVTTKDDGSTLQYPYMLAGIATDVAPTGTWATTGRTREDSNNLRYTFIQAYPGAVDTVTNNNHPNLPQFSNNCQFTPTCGIWANWQKLIYINPGDMLYDDGLSIGFPHDNVMDMAGYATDKQVPIATSLARSFSNLGSYVVAPAVESTRQRRWNGDYREFAILPTEFKPTVSVKIARLGPQGMKLDTRVLTSGANLKTGGGASGGEEVLLAQNGPESAPDGTFFGESGSSGQSSKSSTVSPQATTGTTGYTGYRALFSTTLDTVFVAGGSNSDEENDTIWAYDLRKMRWYPAITQARFAPSAKVRSMALDAARNWLYVMFDIDGSNVQLVRYDLRRDTGTLAQTFTSRPVYPGTYLNTLADGTVVLTASKNGEYLSCAYDAGANRFLGSIQSTTTSVPFPPQLGGSGLVLPVVDASQHVTYTTVTRASFTGTTTCSVL